MKILISLLSLLLFSEAYENHTRVLRATEQRFSIIRPSLVRPAENLLDLEDLKFFNLQKHIGTWKDYSPENLEKGLEFAAKYSIIPNERRTADTNQPMTLIKASDLLDKHIWRHRSEGKKLSVREGTFFSEKKLSVQDVFYLAANFLENYEKNIVDVAKDFLTTTDTVIAWYDKFRDLCQAWCLREFMNPTVKMGGPGKIIEIDETLLYKAKYIRGRLLNRRKQIWIFGLIERGTNNVALFRVDRRDKKTLLPLIEKTVAEGSIIMSDSWKVYDSITDLKTHYDHYKVNHKIEFVKSDDRRVHTQGIESTWSSLKRSLKSYYGLPKHKLDGYLFNYMFRRRLNREKLLNNLIHEMSRFDPNDMSLVIDEYDDDYEDIVNHVPITTTAPQNPASAPPSFTTTTSQQHRLQSSSGSGSLPSAGVIQPVAPPRRLLTSANPTTTNEASLERTPAVSPEESANVPTAAPRRILTSSANPATTKEGSTKRTPAVLPDEPANVPAAAPPRRVLTPSPSSANPASPKRPPVTNKEIISSVPLSSKTSVPSKSIPASMPSNVQNEERFPSKSAAPSSSKPLPDSIVSPSEKLKSTSFTIEAPKNSLEAPTSNNPLPSHSTAKSAFLASAPKKSAAAPKPSNPSKASASNSLSTSKKATTTHDAASAKSSKRKLTTDTDKSKKSRTDYTPPKTRSQYKSS